MKTIILNEPSQKAREKVELVMARCLSKRGTIEEQRTQSERKKGTA